MEYSYLNDTMIMLIGSVIVVLALLRIGLSPILGYLAVGIVIGPHALELVNDVEHIRVLAEFGVVFLMFSVGLEFSIPLLQRMKTAVFGLGGAQVLLTAGIASGIATLLGLNLTNAIIIGGVMAMSSTALVSKQLADQAELHTRHGRNSIGILLFQDMMVVPMLILVAMLSGTATHASFSNIMTALLEGVIALLLIFAFGYWVLRPLFREVSRFRSAELFTLTVLLVVLCSSWLTHQIGLTFALGAFLAGVMLGETEFRHQVESEIRPFRDVLLGFFFITVGMMLNIAVLPQIWLPTLLLLLTFMLFKLLLITGLCHIAGWNRAVSMRTGLILAHGGEFGFAILMLAMGAQLLEEQTGQILLASMLFSMALAPIIIRHNDKITAFLLPGSLEKSQQEIRRHIESSSQDLYHHAIVCGYGRVGIHSMRLLNEHDVSCIAIDLDPQQVQQGRDNQQAVFYGDAGSLALLQACGLSRASVLIVSMIDFNTVIKIIKRVRAVDDKLPIIVRTRKEAHLPLLYQAGATEVIADIFGSDQMVTIDLLKQHGLSISKQ